VKPIKIAIGAIYACKSEIRKREGLGSMLVATLTGDHFGARDAIAANVH
jgi:hypothetical protein